MSVRYQKETVTSEIHTDIGVQLRVVQVRNNVLDGLDAPVPGSQLVIA